METVDLSQKLAGVLVATGLAAAAAGLASWLRPRSRGLAGLTGLLGFACLALAAAAWALRWRVAGHLPLFGTYESSLSLSLAVLLAALLARFRFSAPAGLWPAAGAVAAALAAHGLLFDPTFYALTISERSWVVDVHALLAWAAFGALLANAGFALHRLLVGQEERGAADRRLAFSLSLGFALHSAMLVSGSIYKFLLFGEAWSFDPVETLGFVAWVCYGTLLHLHLMAGWEGRRLARWCLVLFVLLTVSYRGIVYFPSWSSYHIFDMDLRIHLTGAESPEEAGGR